MYQPRNPDAAPRSNSPPVPLAPTATTQGSRFVARAGKPRCWGLFLA